MEERTVLFVKPKHFNYMAPAYDVSVTESEQSFYITVKASGFCQYVELYFKDYDIIFSDNFFDITAPEGITVCVNKADFRCHMTPDLVKDNLVVRSVADSYGS